MSAQRSLRVIINHWSRRLHRWATVATALPLLVVLLSGILLQLKKEMTWVQPPTLKGAAALEHRDLAVSLDKALAAALSVPQAAIQGWEDIDRLDIRPDRGLIKLQARNGWEIQVCLVSGDLLGSAIRRSDLIEALHDGSWFGSVAKLGIFLPSALLVLVLWITGVWLWFMPYVNRWARRSDAS
jgi:uncharacterized iron-regulated membrane protein